MRKGLAANTSKSWFCTLNFKQLNSGVYSSLPTFMCGSSEGRSVEVYLGMLVDNHMNLMGSEEHAVQPYMVAQGRVKKLCMSMIWGIGPTLCFGSPRCKAFRLGCMHVKCGEQSTCKKAASSKAN